MSRKPDYRPEGYYSVTPFLIVRDVPALLEFVRQAFGADVPSRMTGPDGSIVHAEVKIGDSMLMVGPVMPDQSPIPAMLYLYVEDADSTYARAVKAGGTSISAPTNEFWGDRAGAVADGFGNTWWIATKVESLTADEIKRRSDAAMGSGAPTS